MAFGTWIKKRYIRVIPITLVFIIIKYVIDQTSASFGWYLVSTYWFVTALVFYYPILYFIDKVKNGYLYGAICYVVGYAIIYLFVYEEDFFVEPGGMGIFKAYGFFGTVLVGAYIKRNMQKFRQIKIPVALLLCFISGLLWAGVYGCIIFFSRGYEWQFLVTISRILIVVATLSLSINFNEIHSLQLRENGIINLVADATLEIYLVQEFAKEYIGQLTSGGASVLAFWLVAIVGGMICHYFRSFLNS